MLKALVVALSVSVAAGVASNLPSLKAGIAVSNRLTAKKDARVIVATMTPKASWVRPYMWRIKINDTVRFVGVDTGAGPYSFIDTVETPYPACATYRLTVFPGHTMRDSLTKKVSLCRTATRAEVAARDSSGEIIGVFCGGWAHRRSAVAGPDSIAVGPLDSALTAGYVAPVGVLSRNRYTGRVTVVKGDPVRCEAARAFWQVRSG